MLLTSYVADFICCWLHMLPTSYVADFICCWLHMLLTSYVAHFICCWLYLLSTSFVADLISYLSSSPSARLYQLFCDFSFIPLLHGLDAGLNLVFNWSLLFNSLIILFWNSPMFSVIRPSSIWWISYCHTPSAVLWQ